MISIGLPFIGGVGFLGLVKFYMNGGAHIALPILGGLCFLTLVKFYMNGGTNTCYPTLENQIIVVTGSNTGIGYETVLQLAKLNPKSIVLACRSESRAKNAIA
jgi:hypothetical protein